MAAGEARVVKPLRRPWLYWLLGSSVQKQVHRDGERSASPACKPRRVGVQSEVVTSLLMLNNTVLTRWRNFLYGSYFHHSPAVEGWLLACALLSLDSLDQTTRDLLAAPNPGRSWQKQVRAYRRKCPVATTTHHPQAAGETARMHEKRSLTPRPLGKNGSNLAAVSLDRATRYPAPVASGALSPVLECNILRLIERALLLNHTTGMYNQCGSFCVYALNMHLFL